MLHSMKLNSSPFEKIKNGTKTIELRLNDEKRRRVKVGDFIEFSRIDRPSDKIRTKVTALHCFDGFEELYKTLPLIKCGYTAETVQSANPSDMEKFYSEEQQKKYGVVGIELEITKSVENETFDEERALYGSKSLIIKNCRFDGEADGESAVKESSDIQAEKCFFNLRYPFWHDNGLKIYYSEMTELCRAALWYSNHVEIRDSKLHGIKALRECNYIDMERCDINSTEFGWFVNNIKMKDCDVRSEYFMMRSTGIEFDNVTLDGKYFFQYIQNAVFENCNFNTKDAFWHAKNVVVRNSTVKGEYLGWYSENLTFENCKIIGTQPLCYCKSLKLVDCEMTDTDLCFEKSDVQAVITTPVISIKNVLSGNISVVSVGEIIDDNKSSCEITVSQ